MKEKTYDCQFTEEEMTALICSLQTSVIKYLTPNGLDSTVNMKLRQKLLAMVEA